MVAGDERAQGGQLGGQFWVMLLVLAAPTLPRQTVQRLFGSHQGRIDLVNPPLEPEHPAAGNAEPGAVSNHIRRQSLEPGGYGYHLSPAYGLPPDFLYQGGGAGEILRRERIGDGFGQTAVGFAPVGSPRQQLRHLLWRCLLQAGLQQVSKEVVVAVPAPVIVQGHNKQVTSLQPLQQLLAVSSAGDGVAEGAGEAE